MVFLQSFFNRYVVTYLVEYPPVFLVIWLLADHYRMPIITKIILASRKKIYGIILSASLATFVPYLLTQIFYYLFLKL